MELKNIIPPAEIQNAMEKQMKAERERREAVTRAEGEKKAKILEAGIAPYTLSGIVKAIPYDPLFVPSFHAAARLAMPCSSAGSRIVVAWPSAT